MKEKVVLAYSGGLDTSIIITWLKENYDFDVIAVCINIGQDEDMNIVLEKAYKSGATKVYIEDMKEEFITDCVYMAIKANAKYEGKYMLGTSLARPIMAKRLVEIAKKEGAKAICHGCTGKGNDQVRFESSIWAFDSNINIIAPWRIWNIKSREDAIDYAKKNNIEVPVTKEKIYSVDANLWHTSHEGGDIEDLRNEHKENMYRMCVSPEEAIDKASYIDIYFEEGIPKRINNKELNPVEMMRVLNRIGGENGIGVCDILENRLVGMKSRGIYETPGGTILYEAHSILESATLEKDTMHYKSLIAIKYAELIYDGKWYSSLKSSLDAFINETQKNVTGTVKLKLYKGTIKPSGIFTDNALYDDKISSFGESDLYDHKDAEGFIKLTSLPLKIKAMKGV
ncbi:argininosuccinate synthase [Clostridium sp.]|uniref:argininosuccinate synthase n=1 Tax=Clostridium sp. TaxID=1506 RepID=UPI0034638976